MPRILSIDYGLRRTGLAVTDPMQIIATGLTTVDSSQLIPFLRDYFSKEVVELIIIGEPKSWNDTDTHATKPVEKCIKELQKNFVIRRIQNRFRFFRCLKRSTSNWIFSKTRPNIESHFWISRYMIIFNVFSSFYSHSLFVVVYNSNIQFIGFEL